MEFPIQDLLSKEESEQWILEHFHPEGLKCPRCDAPVAEAYEFRTTKESRLMTYRCRHCLRTYNLYTGTVFERRRVPPQKVVLLLRGFLKGEPSKTLAAELELHYTSVLELRRAIQENAQILQPETPLKDKRTETDEMFQNAGEKR
jgi:transposase-like protein